MRTATYPTQLEDRRINPRRRSAGEMIRHLGSRDFQTEATDPFLSPATTSAGRG
jgi:hypothetical protein